MIEKRINDEIESANLKKNIIPYSQCFRRQQIRGNVPGSLKTWLDRLCSQHMGQQCAQKIN